MIYYFSGTGNSYYVAKQLAKLTGDETRSIFEPSGNNGDTIGLVFPVYGWAPPKAVCNFAENISHGTRGKYLFAVMTCGDDAGKTLDILKKTGFRPNSAFTVIMPNTYVSLPGFDVDSDKLRKQKLHDCAARTIHIADEINRRHDTTDIHEGALPRTKTYILGKISAKYLTDDRKFHVNSECVSCSACVKACPTGNISFSPLKRPIWNGNCTGCLACYHTCPHHAINFGTQTLRKGQYTIGRYTDETAD